MVYLTVKQPPMFHQMTLEEFLFQPQVTAPVINENMTNTRTFEIPSLSDRMRAKLPACVPELIVVLEEFNRRTEQLRAAALDEHGPCLLPCAGGAFR